MGELHFMHPEWLWWMLAIPALWLVYRWLAGSVRRQRGQWDRIVDRQLMPFVLSDGTGRSWRWPLVVLSAALTLAVLAMSGPAWEKREIPVYRNQQALVLAMDFSVSMNADDVKPNRLTLARFKLLDILQAREDGQTGLVVFAGDAFVVSPLTDDVNTIAEQVKNLSPDIMPAQGSRVAPAIRQGVELLQQAGMAQGHILLITDGAADTAEAVATAQQARQVGYGVSVLAVGSDAGARIPDPEGGFVLDGSGSPVVARVNSADLEAIANAGGGVYARAALGEDDLQLLKGQWKAADPDRAKQDHDRQVDSWVNAGYWLVLVLLPLAAMAFRRGWLGMVLLAVLWQQPQPARAFSWHDLWKTPDQQGQQALENGQPQVAAGLFRDPEWRAAAAYKSQDYAQAAQQYAGLDTPRSLYNYGNALVRQGKLKEAIQAYDRVLAKDPQHEDARYNRDLVQKALEQQQQQSSQQDQQPSPSSTGQPPPDANSQDQQQPSSGSGQQESQASGQDGNPQQSQQNARNNNTDKTGQVQQQAQQEKEQQKEQQEKAAQAQQHQQREQEGNGKPDDHNAQEESDPRQREQQQATEQWLRRIPDDPAGLWRRKFHYQYQQRGRSSGGDAW